MSCHSGGLTPADSVGHAGGGGIGAGLGDRRRDAQAIPPNTARTAMPTRAATVPANTGPLKVPGSAPAWNFPGGALVVAAGGLVTSPLGIPLTYGRAAEHFRVSAFVAWADPGKAAALKIRS